MKALIFAAGLGERMRPLTETTPKPLLPAGGKPLIVWHLEKLAACGIRDVVINTSWLAEQFPRTLGGGTQWGLRITYSYEGEKPLETGGGMLHALPLLGAEPFLLVNGDIWTDFDFTSLPSSPPGLAHLVMVDAPGYAAQGDFALGDDGRMRAEGDEKLTYAGIGIYRQEILDGWRGIIGAAPGTERTPPAFKLAPLLRAAMADGKISGEHHRGTWTDVGTPERLRQLDASLAMHGENTSSRQ